MNKYIAQLAALEWPKVIAIGVALAAAYYFFMYDNGSSLDTNIKAAQARVETAKKTLAETEKAMADAERFGKEVQSTSDQFEKIVRFMPVSLDSSELTKLINEISIEVGVHPRIEPKKLEPPQSFTQAVKIDLALEGNFAQIVTFLSKISQVQRLLIFDKITLEPNSKAALNTPQGAALTFKATLVGYRYLKDADPDDAKPAAAPASQPVKAGGT